MLRLKNKISDVHPNLQINGLEKELYPKLIK